MLEAILRSISEETGKGKYRSVCEMITTAVDRGFIPPRICMELPLELLMGCLPPVLYARVVESHSSSLHGQASFSSSHKVLR